MHVYLYIFYTSNAIYYIQYILNLEKPLEIKDSSY